MKTLIPLLIIVVLAYLALCFVSWDVNPAHWSAIARTTLIVVLILVSLKPITDLLQSASLSALTTGTREVSAAEFEQNQAVYQKAQRMNVSGLTPAEREAIRDTLAKTQTLLARLGKEDSQIR